MNLFSLSKKLNTREDTIQLLREIELIPTRKFYDKHKREMDYIEEPEGLGRFRCRKHQKYNHSISAAHNTWFEFCHVSLETCIIITYGFARRFTFEQVRHECSIVEGQTVSSETVADRFSFCREVCTLALDKDYIADGLIGGPDTIVEIDECKIGRRKFERGRLREGKWILGMIERGGGKYRLEMCPGNKRDENTLISLIQKHVAAGTKIITDCWKGNTNLEKYGYVHETVNHSTNFVDPDSGAYTQTIEASWRALRARLSRGGIKDDTMINHICEYLWRYEVKKSGRDPFEALLNDIKYVYTGE